MKHLLPFFVLITILLIISSVVMALLNYNLKKRVLDAGPLDEHAVKLLGLLAEPGRPALKNALLLLSGGLGLMAIEYLPYSASDSLFPYGVEAVFLAGGFLAYYFLANQKPE